MGTDNRRVDHCVFVVRIPGQMLKQLLPYASSGPTTEPGMHHTEIAKAFRQIPPRYPGSIAIQHRLNKQSIIAGRTSYRTLPPWQHPFDPLPLIVP